ncbi:hypothetical protein LK994_11650 [Ferruginibacter lapsinanis]|uniref:hypothetical protein n=1 Tax=Ferruginibacter lapsinanis TaxID=563172 RepID=UPI001E5AC6EC|nr:hypothetical protein [Ferruginibacter lapsinanis]UEG49286.1 hypothetical protein LK994_11650 [Ferruginibacter lapsinanis]
MRISLPYLSALIFICLSSFFSTTLLAFDANYIDTTIDPIPDAKVMIANGADALEITPLTSTDSITLIEPVNRTTNKGISTRFFLSDTSFWSFYTNSTQRLTIAGDGKIATTTPLFVNNATVDSTSALRVNGIGRFDSAVYVPGNNNSFIEIRSRVRSITEPDDSISPYTITPMTWAEGKGLPVFRLRHPNTVAGFQTNHHVSTGRDFMILPYEFGTAIEFNGVVECWVGEWSIHKGNYYVDIEGKGNGWGAVHWVGDDVDGGGVRTTARNNTSLGGNVKYGEISVESFTRGSNGDFRFRLPTTENSFQYVYGERGSENIVAKISHNGFFIPVIPSTDSVALPERAQLSFDSSDHQLKVYDGTKWKKLTNDDVPLNPGTYTISGDGISLLYSIPHGLSSKPSYYTVIPTSADAANISYVTADDTFLYVHYIIPPILGTDNLSWNWLIKK